MYLAETFSWVPKIPAETFAFLPGDYEEDIARALHGALEMFASTFFLTVALELCSIPTVKGVLQQPGGRFLYLSAIGLNLFNHLCLGVPLWIMGHVYFRNYCVYEHVIENYFASALRILGVLLVHSLCYYHVHKFFHTNRAWYKYHEYHHQFNKYAPPMASMAVTPVEYLFGYILPFVLSVFVMWPLFPEIKTAIYIIADCNLLIHFPRLEKLSEKLWPAFASPSLHIEHHRKQNINLAAPTFNVDWINDQLENMLIKFKSNSVFGKTFFSSGEPKSG